MRALHALGDDRAHDCGVGSHGQVQLRDRRRRVRQCGGRRCTRARIDRHRLLARPMNGTCDERHGDPNSDRRYLTSGSPTVVDSPLSPRLLAVLLSSTFYFLWSTFSGAAGAARAPWRPDARRDLRAQQSRRNEARGSARPRPAMSSAVPWSGEVRGNGSPSVTFTARPNDATLMAVIPTS